MPADAHELGRGVYDLAEAARYTRLNYSTVRSWFHGKADREPVFRGDYGRVRGDYAISFFDLVDLLVAGQLRAAGVTMRIVRASYEVLQSDIGTSHPFCHERIYTDGKRVIVAVASQIGDARLLDVVSRQQLFTSIRSVLKSIDYRTKLAMLWKISNGVVIDPRRSFGKPVVAGTGVTTFVLANQFHANAGNVELVADLYAVGRRDVLNAVDFEERYGRAAA